MQVFIKNILSKKIPIGFSQLDGNKIDYLIFKKIKYHIYDFIKKLSFIINISILLFFI